MSGVVRSQHPFAAVRSQLLATWATARRALILAGLLATAIAAALSSAIVGGAGDLAALLVPPPARPSLPAPYRPLDSVVTVAMRGGHRVFSLVERSFSPIGDRISRLDLLLARKL
jgi:hypothetical protein